MRLSRFFHEYPVMNDDFGKDYGSSEVPQRGAVPSSRKISFDDFEIERQKSEDEEKRSKLGIPRIKGIKDDLLGAPRKLSSKLFGNVADDGAVARENVVEPKRYESVESAPAELPYFSNEELQLVRVRKIPKSSTPKPVVEEAAQSQIQHVKPSPTQPQVDLVDGRIAELESSYAEIEETDGMILEEELIAAIEQAESIDDTEFDYDEQDAEEEEEPVSEIATPIQNVALAEPELDPALRVYLDTLRGYAAKPRRASDVRDPRKDFVLMLSELLDLLREQVGAMSALFFWTNTRKQQLVLECASVDDIAYSYLIEERRFPIEHDAISRVAIKGEPQLIQSISPQAEYDLIPYYNDSIGVRSLAALPVFFGDSIVAVLACDSLEEESFSPETLRLMTNYSKVISGLVRNYIEAYDLLNSARTLKAARKLFQLAGNDFSRTSARDTERTSEYILRALTEAAGDLVDWQWLSTVAFDDTQRAWVVTGLQAKVSEPYVLPKTRIDLGESIIGRTLRTGKSEHIEQLSQQSIRFSVDEERERSIGHSFLVIPIRTTLKNYGVLVLEHSEAAKYSDVDIETLEHLARSAATSLEIFTLSELVNDRALTDILTGTLNKRGFKERFSEELVRAKEFDEPLSVILFEIDEASKFEDRFVQEDIDTVILSLSNVLQFIKQPFDVLARIGEFTFAVLLIKMTDEDAFLWSEKVRQKIVSEVIALSRKSFTVTTSIGVAGARRNSTADELLVCARMALDKAKERGGNEVIVY